jgi:hypothetical protein
MAESPGYLEGRAVFFTDAPPGPDWRDPNAIGTPAASCLRNSCAYRSRATLGLLRRRRVISKVFRNRKCLYRKNPFFSHHAHHLIAELVGMVESRRRQRELHNATTATWLETSRCS